MINWDDMRVFIAVARSGSFLNAARRIGLDPTTVARRTRRLETKLKATLFVRSRKGLQLTAAGALLSEAGAGVEAAMDTASEIGALDPLAGTVRVSVAEGFGGHILAPALPAFAASRSGMRVELVASPGYLSPTTREVDIAITSSPPESSRLVVEKLSDYEIGLYASVEYLAAHGTPVKREELKKHQFIGYVDDLLYTQELRFLDSFEPNLKRPLTCSSLRVQVVLAEAGGGICALPHFLAADGRRLVRVLPNIMVRRTYWMAIHGDLYETARMRAVRRWLINLVDENRALLTPSLMDARTAEDA
jgi:DNA-binding transcriptional LysR family regulator